MDPAPLGIHFRTSGFHWAKKLVFCFSVWQITAGVTEPRDLEMGIIMMTGRLSERRREREEERREEKA